MSDLLSWLAFGADASILLTYWHLARHGSSRPFHWANALGAVPLIAIEAIAGVWPAVILSLAFGLIAVVGLIRGEDSQ